MRVLIGHEEWGHTREAFRRRGHDAWSCNLNPARDGSQFHLQCDIFEVIDDGWDLGIFHPDCTYLTNSAEWAYAEPNYERYPGAIISVCSQARLSAPRVGKLASRLWPMSCGSTHAKSQKSRSRTRVDIYHAHGGHRIRPSSRINMVRMPVRRRVGGSRTCGAFARPNGWNRGWAACLYLAGMVVL